MGLHYDHSIEKYGPKHVVIFDKIVDKIRVIPLP